MMLHPETVKYLDYLCTESVSKFLVQLKLVSIDTYVTQSVPILKQNCPHPEIINDFENNAKEVEQYLETGLNTAKVN